MFKRHTYPIPISAWSFLLLGGLFLGAAGVMLSSPDVWADNIEQEKQEFEPPNNGSPEESTGAGGR